MGTRWSLSTLFASAAIAGCGGTGAGTADARSSSGPALRADTILFTGGEYTVEAGPEVFGTTTTVIGRMHYRARADANGKATGRFRFSEAVDGTTTHYAGAVTCVGVYDFDGRARNRAKIGALIESSDDPSFPPGTFIWWQAIDDGDGHAVDKSTFTGFGDQAANEAFCASPGPPRFGPFPVRGEIEVDGDPQ
jgi:hypothetical protein